MLFPFASRCLCMTLRKNITFLSLTIAFNCTSSVVMGTMRMIWTTLMTFDSVGNSFELFRNGVNSDDFSESEGKRPMMMAAVLNIKMLCREWYIPAPRYKCIGWWMDGWLDDGWMIRWWLDGWVDGWYLPTTRYKCIGCWMEAWLDDAWLGGWWISGWMDRWYLPSTLI